MAKTWTIREAYEALKAGDKDAIADFGKRFPLVTTALAQAGNNAGLDAFMNALPDRVTTRTVEMVLKEGVQPVDEDADEEVAEEKPVKDNKKSAKAEKPTAKKGKAKKEEVVEDDDDEEEEIEDDDDEVIEEEEVEEIDYSAMSVIELFKECKKRKLKVEPKQKASVYIKALKADDEANASDDEDADEDWDEEEEVEEKPTKKSKATKTAKAEKPAKSSKKSKADDDDDEWDI